MKNKLWLIVLIVSLAAVVVSGINVFRLSREYQKGINEYQQLESYASVKEEAPVQEESTEAEETEEESLIPVSVDIQYDELKKINEDFAGWLYYEPLDISYPIVRGNDNDYYTHYTFEGEKNSSGAIFMDFLNKTDCSDYNTIVYGHNMRNGSMFQNLHKFEDEAFFKKHKEVYVYTPKKTYTYTIFAAYKFDDRHLLKTFNFKNKKKFENYLRNVKNIRDMGSHVRKDQEVTSNDKIITLSTCVGGQPNNRYLVQAVLTDERSTK